GGFFLAGGDQTEETRSTPFFMNARAAAANCFCLSCEIRRVAASEAIPTTAKAMVMSRNQRGLRRPLSGAVGAVAGFLGALEIRRGAGVPGATAVCPNPDTTGAVSKARTSPAVNQRWLRASGATMPGRRDTGRAPSRAVRPL